MHRRGKAVSWGEQMTMETIESFVCVHTASCSIHITGVPEVALQEQQTIMYGCKKQQNGSWMQSNLQEMD